MIDRAITEISATRPSLRKELRLSSRESRSGLVYVLEDPLTGKFFELGEREHAALRLLDGTHTLSQIVAATVSGPQASGLNEREATSLVRMLADAHLLVAGTDDQSQRIRRAGSDRRDEDAAAKGAQSVFSLKIPLGNPDHWLGAIHRLLAPIPGWIFFVLWLAVVGAGAGTYAEHAFRFREELQGVLQVKNLAIFGFVWLILKAIHEFCHGIVCKRFGGAVPEAGISLLLFMTPLAYVDASSSIRFPSRWQRILVSAAGIGGEFFVAALALMAWAALPPGVLGSVLHQVVVISTVTTLLFNANPLMRFDGYYIASDLLGISNLSTKGQQLTRYLTKRWLFGIKGVQFPLRGSDGGDRAIIVVYGLAAALWRIVVMVGLFVTACHLFQGAGRLLAVIAGAGTVLVTVRSIWRYFRKNAALEQASFAKVALRTLAMAGLATILITKIEFAPSITAAAIVDSGHEGEVRVECPGFIEELFFHHGDEVHAGELIARLRNDEIVVEQVSLEREMRQARLRGDLFFADDKVAAFQAEQENIRSLASKLTDLQNYGASLELRAPRDGRLFARSLDSSTGSYLEKGEIIFRIVSETGRELRIALPQSCRNEVGEVASGSPIEIFDPSDGIYRQAILDRIRPQALTELPHPGLSSAAGGPLLVRQSYDGGEPILVEPHFIAVAHLPKETQLREGQLLWARFDGQSRHSLAHWSWQRFRDWTGREG
jgi:putative peptide zinc metalloprotease protein